MTAGLAGKRPINADSAAWRELMQAALESMDEGFTVFDRDLRLLAWNRRFFEQYEFPRSYRRVGTPFENFMRYNAQRGEYGEGDVEEMVRSRVELARQFLPHTVERTRPNGRVFEIRGNPIPGVGFVTMYKEITERKRAEAALEESRQHLEARVAERTAELKASEDWIRQVADAVPVLIGYVDGQGGYRFANRRYEEWFGLEPANIVGRPAVAVALETSHPGLNPFFDPASAERDVSRELSVSLPSGRKIEVVMTYRPHYGADRNVQGYFVLGQDVTERKQAEALVRHAQKMQAVGQLTGGLSHDFNNLLAIIIGNLALAVGQPGAARHEGEADGDLIELIEPALDAARRGATLVKRLLAFAREQPMHSRVHNPKQVIAGMEELLQRTLGRSISVDIRLSGQSWPVRIDAGELENAILNLALNSRDAMPDGGNLILGVKTVSMTSERWATLGLPAGDYVVVSVSDDGAGMAPSVVEHAFEPFFTTKAFGGGSGLGLSMVYGFARRSGGMAEIESEPGKGTTVRIYLPRASGDAPKRTPGLRQPDLPRGREHVLVVEDEPAVLQLTVRFMRDLGYSVHAAASAAEALCELDAHADIQLLVTDVELQNGMNGIELAKQARRRAAKLRVLLMSGYPDKAMQAAGEGDDRFELLSKPFEWPELAYRAREVLLSKDHMAAVSPGPTQ